MRPGRGILAVAALASLGFGLNPTSFPAPERSPADYPKPLSQDDRKRLASAEAKRARRGRR